MTANILITLANLGQPRRPSRSVASASEPILATCDIATRQLTPLIDQPVSAQDLADLRALQRSAAAAAEAILVRRTPNCAVINRLAGNSAARIQLSTEAGRLSRRLAWRDPSIAAGLARRLIDELAELKPDRLRRCDRPECRLLFYDTTRSRTRRWHAENPCGWRARQQQRRSAH